MERRIMIRNLDVMTTDSAQHPGGEQSGFQDLQWPFAKGSQAGWPM